MRLVIFLQGERGKTTLVRLQAERSKGYEIVGVVYEKGAKASFYSGDENLQEENWQGLPVFCLDGLTTSDDKVLQWLEAVRADLWILAGCRHILENRVLSLPLLGTIGLHSGKLPEYRGSSPLNWALIRGCHAHWFSVVEVGLGVDTGKVLEEKLLPIGVNDTIVDLHKRAQEIYPEMIIKALERIQNGSFVLQNSSQKHLPLHKNRQENLSAGAIENMQGGYFPRRFPNDGFIDWHTMGAWDVHNMVRALTKPYPCAKVWYQGKIWNIEVSALSCKNGMGKNAMDDNLIGYPGRIYRVKGNWLQVATSDRAIWIKAEDGLTKIVKRYDVLGLASSKDANA